MSDSLIINHRNEWLKFLTDLKYSELIAVTDSNTETHCLPHILQDYVNNPIKTYTLPSGEGSKNIIEASNLWKWMLEQNIDRNAVLLAIGGGMVTDLVGFVASTYKRGIRTIYFPTTNLAMCDAALGGKTGFNFLGIKNQIGTFHNPECIVLDTTFLKSLPKRELNSGFFETVKHAMIGDADLWEQIINDGFDLKDERSIHRSMLVKQSIVAQDYKEGGVRQALNFGHTIGHAIEAKAVQCGRPLLHGEAIAFGMLAEAWISSKQVGLKTDVLTQLQSIVRKYVSFNASSFTNSSEYNELMLQDKKNHHGQVICSLLQDIGIPAIGQIVEEITLLDSIEFAKSELLS